VVVATENRYNIIHIGTNLSNKIMQATFGPKQIPIKQAGSNQQTAVHFGYLYKAVIHLHYANVDLSQNVTSDVFELLKSQMKYNITLLSTGYSSYQHDGIKCINISNKRIAENCTGGADWQMRSCDSPVFRM
jgi:hypothetical protein